MNYWLVPLSRVSTESPATAPRNLRKPAPHLDPDVVATLERIQRGESRNFLAGASLPFEVYANDSFERNNPCKSWPGSGRVFTRRTAPSFEANNRPSAASRRIKDEASSTLLPYPLGRYWVAETARGGIYVYIYSSQLLCFLITHITVFEFFVPKGETKGGSASTLYSNEKKERGEGREEGKEEREGWIAGGRRKVGNRSNLKSFCSMTSRDNKLSPAHYPQMRLW